MELVDEDTFEALVAEALDGLPDQLLALLDNVVVMVDDSHPEGLLGLYEGLPRTEREAYGSFELPDRVTLYRQGLCDHVRDLAELREEVMVTVVHELAHHLGIDDDRLHELGWD